MPGMEGSVVDAPSRATAERTGGPVAADAGVAGAGGGARRSLTRPPVLNGRWRTAAEVGLVVVVLVGIVLRFWTRSALWLDEALTVDISRLPLHEIPSYLKRDGAPPLFYVLLHFWMGIFGTSREAVRALPGVLSVATLPVAWVAGRRYGGRTVAWVVVALLASSPFAVYYATEARMYSLVMFLTACGFVAVDRALRRPRPGNLVAVAVVGAALLYSQYWALYLLGALGLWLAFQAIWGRAEWRGNARFVLGALVVSALAFVPWLPTFFYQSAHTGTPWSKPPNFAAVIDSVTGFGDNQATHQTAGTNQGRLLALGYFVLGGLALFGLARDRWHIELDLRTRPAGRGVAFVVVITLFAAIAGGILTGSAFSPRYASVVFVPLILLVGFGSLTLLDARTRAGVVAVLAVAGLVASAQNIWTYRTQAPQIAAVINSQARPGDIVAFCPDQLGPSVYQLVAPGRYDQITYPRSIGSQYVDWVDYKTVAEASNPAVFARELEAKARAGGHAVWLVSADGYQGFGTKCQILGGDLLTAAGFGAHQWVNANPDTYYEPMQLTEFKPADAPSAPTSATR